MGIRYVTIEREYGSGGTKIAHRLSEETHIPCYGREILEAVAKSQNVAIEEIEKYEENVTSSFLYTFYAMSQANNGSVDMLTKEGHIFVAEQDEIRKIATDGKAIFLGHCASEALKEERGVVRVFIRCSDEDKKHQRIIEDYGIADADVERTKKRFDKKRSNYFYANTAQRWSDYSNYDIVLDSGVLGVEGCVAVLKGLFA